MRYYRFFTYQIHFIFKYSIIKLSHFLFFNLLINFFINLSQFHIYIFVLYVLNLIFIFM